MDDVRRHPVVSDGPLELVANFVDHLTQHFDLASDGFDGVDEALDAFAIDVLWSGAGGCRD